nr:PREDICTED: uncharacterized protein LOC109633018 [Paralichthys olivaceus]
MKTRIYCHPFPPHLSFLVATEDCMVSSSSLELLNYLIYFVIRCFYLSFCFYLFYLWATVVNLYVIRTLAEVSQGSEPWGCSIVNALFGCSHQRAPADFTLKVHCTALCCSVRLPLSHPGFICNLLNLWETAASLLCIMATSETMFPDRSDFDYDYETLRTTGVVLAVVMFVSGILIALSKKFTKCVKSSSNSSSSGTQIPKTEVPPQTV